MRQPGRTAGPLGALPLGAFFAVFYLAPFILLLLISLDPAGSVGGFDLGSYAAFFTDAFSIGILLDTLLLGLEVTVVTALLALPLAMLYRTAGPTAQSLLILAILLPMLTSTIVRTFGWIVILGREGVINSSLIAAGWVENPLRLLYTHGGLVVALAQICLPLMVLPILNSMARIDDRVLQASEGLGASKWRTFAAVILPLSAPGILAGSLLTFAFAATAFVTQTLVGGGRLLFMPLLIYQQAIGLQKWSFAAVLSIVFMISVVATMGVVDWVVRSHMRGVNE